MPGRRYANMPDSIARIERNAAPTKQARHPASSHTRSNAFLAANIDSPSGSSTPMLDGASEGIGFDALGDIEATVRQIATDRGFEIPTTFEAPPRPGDAHQVRRGDSLTAIAARMSELEGREITVEALYEANRGTIGADPNQIDVNQVLDVPPDLEALRLEELHAQEQLGREALATSMLPTEAELMARAGAREQAGRQAMAESRVEVRQQQIEADSGALDQAGRHALAMSMLPTNEDGQHQALAYAIEQVTAGGVVAPEYQAAVANGAVQTVMHDIVASGERGLSSEEEMLHLAAAGANLGSEEIDTFAGLAADAFTEDIHGLLAENPYYTSEHITSLAGKGLEVAPDSFFGVHFVDHLEDPTVKEAMAIATLAGLNNTTNAFADGHDAMMHNVRLTDKTVSDELPNWNAMPPAERQALVNAGRGAGYDEELLKTNADNRSGYLGALDQAAYAESIWGTDDATLGYANDMLRQVFRASPRILDGMVEDGEGSWVADTAGVEAMEQSMAEHAAGRPSWLYHALGGTQALGERSPELADGLRSGLILGMSEGVGQLAASGTPSQLADYLESFGEFAELAGITDAGVGADAGASEIREMAAAYADGSLSQDDFAVQAAGVLQDTFVHEEMSDANQARMWFLQNDLVNSIAKKTAISAINMKLPGFSAGFELADGEASRADIGAGAKLARQAISKLIPSMADAAKRGQIGLNVVLGLIDAWELLDKGDTDAALATLAGTAAMVTLAAVDAPVLVIVGVGIASAALVTTLKDDPDDPTREAIGQALAAATIDELVPDLGVGEQGAETRQALIEALASNGGRVSAMGALTAYAAEAGLPPAELIQTLADLYERGDGDFDGFLEMFNAHAYVSTTFTEDGDLLRPERAHQFLEVLFRDVVVEGGPLNIDSASEEANGDGLYDPLVNFEEVVLQADPWAVQSFMPPLVQAYQAAAYSGDPEQLAAAGLALEAGRRDLGLPDVDDLQATYLNADFG